MEAIGGSVVFSHPRLDPLLLEGIAIDKRAENIHRQGWRQAGIYRSLHEITKVSQEISGELSELC